jgi:uncharacterized protein
MTAILDTSFLFALTDQGDRNYQRVLAVAQSAKEPLVLQVECLTAEDLVRVHGILEQYTDSQLDFTDAAIVAIAERLNITRVYTLDRRDFSIIRPSHCDYFELLP